LLIIEDNKSISRRSYFVQEYLDEKEQRGKKASRVKVNSSQMRIRQFTVHPEMYRLPKLNRNKLSPTRRNLLLTKLQELEEAQCCGCEVSILFELDSW
jgi:hypothetical protein